MNTPITPTDVEKKFGKKIPVRKIEKMFGKNHGIPIADGHATIPDFFCALRQLHKEAINAMKEGSEVAVLHPKKEGDRS